MRRELNPQEKAYYARQISLAQVGLEGQTKLKNSSALLIGLGGLGSPLALYLAGAGVGRLGIFEFDTVETSNLHRQVLYGSSLQGQKKIEAGVRRLKDLNPNIEIEIYPFAIDVKNAREIVKKYDVVADGADNFATRYLVNDACVLENRPLVSASILCFEGQLSVFHFENGPCYRCLYPKPPPEGMAPSCNEAGVLGVLPGVMGTLQATEVLKILLGLGEVVSKKLLTYDALSASFGHLEIQRDPKCAVCGDHPSIRDVQLEADVCGPVPTISAAELFGVQDQYLIVDVREADERGISKIEKSLHIPLREILENRAKIPSDRPVVVHCASGKRSQRAVDHLIGGGFKNIFNLSGGINAWLDFLNRR